VLDLHVKVERALGSVRLIAPKVWTLMYFRDLIVATTEMPFAATWVDLVIIIILTRLIPRVFKIILV